MKKKKETRDDVSRQKLDMIVAAAREHKAFDLVLLRLDRYTSITDYFFICSCRSTRQVQAVAEHIQEYMKKTGGFRVIGVEGKTQGLWVLMDYGDVVVHIFHEPVRDFYNLEGLWSDAERIDAGGEEGASRENASPALS